MTPTSHAASSTTYGAGTATNYGHVKISDTYSGTPSTSAKAANSIAASQWALQTVNDKKVDGYSTIYNNYYYGRWGTVRFESGKAEIIGINTGVEFRIGFSTAIPVVIATSTNKSLFASVTDVGKSSFKANLRNLSDGVATGYIYWIAFGQD